MDLEEPTSVAPPRAEVGWSASSIALVILATLAIGAAVTYLGPVIKPFFIAIMLFFIAKSAADVLQRWHLPPLLAYLALLFLVAGVGMVVMLFLAAQVNALLDQRVHYETRIIEVANEMIAFTGYDLTRMRIDGDMVVEYIFPTSFHIMEMILLAFFYLLFMIIGAGKFAHRVHRAVSAEHAGQLFKITTEIGEGMEEFIKVKTLVGLGMAASMGVLIAAFGIQYWPLWASLFFLLNYIHYIGSMVALAPPILVAYVDMNDPVRAALLGILLVVNRLIWVDYVEIRLSGERLNIEPVLIFLWLTYWGWVWGVVGLILAYPMLASLRIILEHISSTRSLAFLMSEE